jgi:hypothetical protein
MVAAYTPGDQTRAQARAETLLEDRYDLYRAPGTTRQYPAAPKYTNRPCSIQMVARLVGNTGLQGESETAPTRFILRVGLAEDVKARDRVKVTNHKTGEVTQHTVQSTRWPHSIMIWKIADISDPE